MINALRKLWNLLRNAWITYDPNPEYSRLDRLDGLGVHDDR